MPNFRIVLAISSFALLSASAAHAQTPLPHAEHWGNIIHTGCGPQWNSGCEAGWTAHGAANTLKVMTAVGHPGAQSVMIKPGTAAAPNGVTKTFSVTGGRRLEIEVPAMGIDGGATFRTRVRFVNAAGTVIGTQDRVKVIESCSSTLFTFAYSIPATAVIAQVSYSAFAGTSPSSRVVLAFGPVSFPWILFWPTTISPDPPPPADEGESCNAECDPCNVSCEDDEVLINSCSIGPPPGCEVTQECYCESSGGTCDELTTQTSWY